MKAKEFFKCMTMLKSVYDNFDIADSKEKLRVWYELFKNDNYETLKDAVITYCSTNPYKPTPAGLKECMAKLQQINQVSSDECWDKIQKCIRNYGYYRLDEAFEWLKETDLLTYKIAKTMNLKELCLSENTIADRAHFLKIYESISKRQRDEVMIPKEISKRYDREQICKNNIKMLADKFDMNS